MASSAARLGAAPRGPRLINPQLVRTAHAYGGALFAPTLLFFAVSGGLQTYDLHKAGPDYRPSAALVAMARLHKDQLLQAPPAADDAGGTTRRHAERRPRDTAAPRPWTFGQAGLKLFAAAGAAVLVLTTLLGLYLSLLYRRDRAVIVVLIGIGTLVPMGLMLL